MSSDFYVRKQRIIKKLNGQMKKKGVSGAFETQGFLNEILLDYIIKLEIRLEKVERNEIQ